MQSSLALGHQMAAFMTLSPVSPSLGQAADKPSPVMVVKIKPGMLDVKRRRNYVLLASLHAGNEHAINGLPSHLQRNADDVVLSDSLTEPWLSTHSSVSGEPRLRVTFQGVHGAYSELAAQKAYPNCVAMPCDKFDTVFEIVEQCLAERAVLPIESSLGGSIHRSYDLLLRHKLHIVGEVKYAVRYCLLANHGVEVEDLKRVLSHPQALAQCEHTLSKLPLVTEAMDGTAHAAKHVALHKLKDTGAIASSAAAKIHDLNIVAEIIQDDCDNVTRFLILAREPTNPSIEKPFKTSIVFSMEAGPGALFKALAVFALRQINLAEIVSRPLRQQPLGRSNGCNNGSATYFDYLFYVDFEGSMADQVAQNALKNLKELATFLRVLGTYPVDTSIM